MGPHSHAPPFPMDACMTMGPHSHAPPFPMDACLVVPACSYSILHVLGNVVVHDCEEFANHLDEAMVGGFDELLLQMLGQLAWMVARMGAHTPM